MYTSKILSYDSVWFYIVGKGKWTKYGDLFDFPLEPERQIHFL